MRPGVQPDEPGGDPPWFALKASRLIVVGVGDVSTRLAADLAAQCQAQRIDRVVRELNEVTEADLIGCGELLMCLPDRPRGVLPDREDGRAVRGDLLAGVRPYVPLVRQYRETRPHGLMDLLAGRKEWSDVGVVQAFGLHATASNPKVRPLFRDAVDEWRPVTSDQACDLFEAYRGPTTEVTLPGAVRPRGTGPAGLIEAQKAVLTSWGVRDLDTTWKVVELINDQRARYREGDRPAATRCPLGEHDPRTALDLILDGGWNIPKLRARTPQQRKRHQENFAGIWRDIQPLLADIGVERPEARRKDPKGAVEDLHKLFTAARAVKGLNRF